MNVKRIKILAHWIEHLVYADIPCVNINYDGENPDEPIFNPRDHCFSMQDYGFECGSPACVAGWAVELFHKKPFKEIWLTMNTQRKKDVGL